MRVYFIGLTKPVSGLFEVFHLSLEYYKKIKMRLPKKIVSPTYCLHHA